jgi:ATP phosphoribosyltransferase
MAITLAIPSKGRLKEAALERLSRPGWRSCSRATTGATAPM